MEGAQQHKIDLEGTLNTSSNDMLVPVSRGTFLHNWQKYKGGVLSNSVRYEKNGWAAGWNVFNFDYNKLRLYNGKKYYERSKISDGNFTLDIYDDKNAIQPTVSVPYTVNSKILAGPVDAKIVANKIVTDDFVIDLSDYSISPDTFLLSDIQNIPSTLSEEVKVKDNEQSLIKTIMLSAPSDITSAESGVTKYNKNNTWGTTAYKDYKFKYEDNKLYIVKENGNEDVIDVTLDSNTLLFNYSDIISGSTTLSMSISSLFMKMDKFRLQSSDAIDLVVCPGADVAMPFNRITFDKNDVALTPNSYKDLYLKLPVWLFAEVKVQAQNTHAKDPYVYAGCVQFKPDAPGANIRITYQNGSFTENILGTADWTDLNVTERFIALTVSNALVPSGSWSPYKYKINTNPYWCFSTYDFRNFREGKLSWMSNILGDVYTVKSGNFIPESVLAYNDIFDKDNLNSTFYENNIDGYRSIKLYGEPSVADMQDDVEYVMNNFLNDDVALCNRYVCNLNYTPTEYSPTDPEKTYDELYDSDGKYIGGTFEQTDRILSDTDAFWPFEYVPCFNYKGEKCYYVEDNSAEPYIITSLDEFKRFVLGNYAADYIYDGLIVPNQVYSRTRDVIHYDIGYDFDYYGDSEGAKKRLWENRWKELYPNKPSPQEMSIEFSDDNYDNYNDINIVGKQPTLFYTPASWFVTSESDGNILLDLFNSDNIIIYQGTPVISQSCNVYYGYKNVTNLYATDTTITPGKLEYKDIEMSLPAYTGETGERPILLKHKPGDRAISSVPAVLTSGLIRASLAPNSSNTWVSSVHIDASEGELSYNYALADGIERIEDFDFINTTDGGISLSVPLWGYVGVRLNYAEASSQTDILTNVTLSQIPVSSTDNRIWLDRANTKYYLDCLSASLGIPNADEGFVIGLDVTDEGLFYYSTSETEEFTQLGLEASSSVTSFTFRWTPSYKNSPTNIVPEFNTTSNLNHSDISVYKNALSNIDVAIQLSDDDYIISIPTGGDKTLDILFNSTTSNVSLSDDVTVQYTDGTQIVFKSFGPVNYSNVKIDTIFNVMFKDNIAKVFLCSEPYSFVSNEYAQIGRIKYIFNNKQAYVDGNKAETNVNAGTAYDYTISVKYDVLITIDFQVPQCFVDGYTISNNIISDGIDQYDMNEFDIHTGTISVKSTDINTNKTKRIGKIISDNEYQIVKQQWNSTTDVENYWWIDAKHILYLTKYDFVLLRNTGRLDDWNGNEWEKIYEVDRAEVLTSNVNRYYVPNVYTNDDSKLEAPFITLELIDNKIHIVKYNVRNKMAIEAEYDIDVGKVSFGEAIAPQFISNSITLLSYSAITTSLLLSTAEWTFTQLDDRLMIGCHLTNGLDQWTIICDDTDIIQCIHGYGYVGVHGELTGGQIPDKYCDNSGGFTGIVHPLSDLDSSHLRDRPVFGVKDVDDIDKEFEIEDINEINQLNDIIVGTEKQHWFVSKELDGIVSHITYSNGTFTKHVLPITNNYSAIYGSQSFGSALWGDLMLAPYPLESLFTFSGASAGLWKAVCVACGYPIIWALSPRRSSLAYLQQTLGQYAYVHYNSINNMPESEARNVDTGKLDVGTQTPDLYDAYTFDKQIVKQDISLDTLNRSFAGILMASFASVAHDVNDKKSVNEASNTTTVFDKGALHTQYALENMSSLIANGFTSNTSDTGISSKVTAIKSLDMFYSMSDNQRVFAGPGFVEHQFVADCISQSVTDVKADGRVNQLNYFVSALTLYDLKLKYILAEYAAEVQIENGKALASTGGWKGLAGVALVVTGYVTKALSNTINAAYNAMQQMFSELGGVTSSTETVYNNKMDIETKHKYGEKNEEFMWPCFGVDPNGLVYTDESVEAGLKRTDWPLTLTARKVYRDASNDYLLQVPKEIIPETSSFAKPVSRSINAKDGNVFYNHEGKVPFYQASCYGTNELRRLPKDMAKIEGVKTFLPEEPFKNDNIGMSEPVFTPSLSQDYIIEKSWDLAQYCTYGTQQWVCCKDTKIIDCAPSNMFITPTFCGIASPYTAVELKRGLSKEYMRPWAITPDVLAINCTGYNTIYEDKLYHSFDGISYRIIDMVGSSGLGKNMQSYLYSFQVNDRFKRSNKLPALELQGNFISEPIQALDTIDKVWTKLTISAKEKGMEAGTIGEDKDLIRWALPIFTEPVSTLPAAVKTLTAMHLGVVEGITSLCTDLANNQIAYKAPTSVDFVINKQKYRITNEYICSVQTENGIDILTDLVPTLGLKYIGSTQTEAYLYSPSTRFYYVFTGAGTISKVDLVNRFRSMLNGYWDFVNQTVVIPCLLSEKNIQDTDTEIDNIIVVLAKNTAITGELPPPIPTIFNDKSWYKIISLPSGLAYQGPNRVIINRDVVDDSMVENIKHNYGKWTKVNKETFDKYRQYPDVYRDVKTEVKGVDGWTHNQFIFATSPLGMDENIDCMFEWCVTFYWTPEMEKLYSDKQFAVVNIAAETTLPNGSKVSRPTHVYIHKKLFQANGQYGYYSFRFQSKNGSGNRERLQVWSDAYIAISDITCDIKPITSRRNEILTQQLDITNMEEI